MSISIHGVSIIDCVHLQPRRHSGLRFHPYLPDLSANYSRRLSNSPFALWFRLKPFVGGQSKTGSHSTCFFCRFDAQVETRFSLKADWNFNSYCLPWFCDDSTCASLRGRIANLLLHWCRA